MFKRVCICICLIFYFAIVTVAREPSGGLIKPREEPQPEENTSSYSAAQEEEDMKNAIAYRESFLEEFGNLWYSALVERVTQEKVKELIVQNSELFDKYISFFENIDSDRVIITYDMNMETFIYEMQQKDGVRINQVPTPEGHEIIDEMYQKLIDEGLVLPENKIFFGSRISGFSRIISIGISSDHSMPSPCTLTISYDNNNWEPLGCCFYKDWFMSYTVTMGYIRLF